MASTAFTQRFTTAWLRAAGSPWIARRPEARFRLAQIFQAQGDYASAESL